MRRRKVGQVVTSLRRRMNSLCEICKACERLGVRTVGIMLLNGMQFMMLIVQIVWKLSVCELTSPSNH